MLPPVAANILLQQCAISDVGFSLQNSMGIDINITIIIVVYCIMCKALQIPFFSFYFHFEHLLANWQCVRDTSGAHVNGQKPQFACEMRIFLVSFLVDSKMIEKIVLKYVLHM